MTLQKKLKNNEEEYNREEKRHDSTLKLGKAVINKIYKGFYLLAVWRNSCFLLISESCLSSDEAWNSEEGIS